MSDTEAPKKTGKKKAEVELEKGPDGKPLLPEWDDMPTAREAIKDLVRGFVTAHYSMPRQISGLNT